MSVQHIQEIYSALLIGRIRTLFSNIIGLLLVFKHKLTKITDFPDITNRPAFYLKTKVLKAGFLSPTCSEVKTNSIDSAQLCRLLHDVGQDDG
jgi:hypothetical protein